MATNPHRGITFDPLVGGTVENRYQICEKLASGGGGAVYLATDSKMMGRCVVVKILLRDLMLNEDTRRKFEHEKEALARLDHPGIVSILDSGTLSDGTPFFVMPFVAGRTLRSILDEDRLPAWDFCRTVIGSVADALGAAHERGILHRDVKPANVMVDIRPGAEARVLLIDFGIARVFESRISPITEVGRPLGTVLYVAPEQLQGDVRQTPSSDIYSCAVVAYEMLTGKLPFEPKSMFDMMELQRAGLTVPPSSIRAEIPETIDAILRKALDYIPEERYQDAREFGREMVRELKEVEAGVEHSGPRSQVTRTRVDIEDGSPNRTDRGVIRVTDEFADPALPGGEIDLAGHPDTRDFPSTETPAGRRGLKWILGVAAAAALLLIAVVSLWYGLRRPAEPARTLEPPPPVAQTPARSLEYYFVVEDNGRGEPKSGPYHTDGRESFATGAGFSISLSASDQGRLYIFNEGLNDRGEPEINMLFPTSVRNGGSPEVRAGEQVATATNYFTGRPGTESLWLIWTQGNVPELENARKNAMETGTVSDRKTAESLRTYLASYPVRRLSVSGSGDFVTRLQTDSDAIVHRVELAHK